MYLSVIIPAYNEEKRIEKTLFEVQGYLSRKQYNYKIIAVNDGSKDGTAEILNELRLKLTNLEIIDNKENRGKGYVVRQGLLAAKGDWRLFMDADNSTLIEEIEKFLPYLKQYDIIIGSRGMEDSKIIIPQPLYRIILGKLYGLLVKIIVGLFEIKDMQCGFKLLNAKAVENILSKCQINGWSFDSEILIIAKKLGYKIKEVPVSWMDQPKTNMRFGGMAKSILDLLKIRLNLILGKYELGE